MRKSRRGGKHPCETRPRWGCGAPGGSRRKAAERSIFEAPHGTEAGPKYPIAMGVGEPKWSAVPLVEPIRRDGPGQGPGYLDWQYPNNIQGSALCEGEASRADPAPVLRSKLEPCEWFA